MENNMDRSRHPSNRRILSFRERGDREATPKAIRGRRPTAQKDDELAKGTPEKIIKEEVCTIAVIITCWT